MKNIFALFVLCFIFGCNKSGSNPGGGTPGPDDPGPGDDGEYVLGFSQDPIPDDVGGKIFFDSRYYSYDFNDVYMLDFKKGHENEQAFTFTGYNFFGVSPNGNFVICEEEGLEECCGNTTVYDLSGSAYGTAEGGPYDDGYCWTSDSRYAYYGSYYDGIFEIDTQKKTSRCILGTPGETYAHDTALSTDDRYLIYTHHSWGTEAEISYFDRSSGPKYTSKLLWSGESGHDERLWHSFLDDKRYIYKITFAEKDKYCQIKQSNIEAPEENHTVVDFEDFIEMIALSPDKSLVIFLSESRIFITRVGQWEAKYVDRVDEDQYGVSQSILCWSPDSRYFAFSVQHKVTKYNEVHLYSIDRKRKWLLTETPAGDPNRISWVK